MLNKSAAAPNAVFSSAVLKRSAPAPVAVLKLPVCVAKERKPTNCCVRRAGGEAKKGLLPFCRGEVGIASIWRRDNRLCLGSGSRTDREMPIR